MFAILLLLAMAARSINAQGCDACNVTTSTTSTSMTLTCPGVGEMCDIQFASFGNPTGSCSGNPAFAAGSCQDSNAYEVVQTTCLGKQSCVLKFDDFSASSCSHHDSQNTLAVQAACCNCDSRSEIPTLSPTPEPLPCARPSSTHSTNYAVKGCAAETKSGKTCTPTCATGYTASGSLAETCIDGVFSTPAGTCVGNPCARPAAKPTYDYSLCAASTPSGQSCSVECLPGYTLSGKATVTCSLGDFSAFTGSCSPSSCPRPPSTTTTNFAVSTCPPETASGKKCTPKCKTGYTASASLSQTCTKGVFGAPAGQCATS